MTREEAQIIIGNIPIKPEALDDCYDITEYQEAKTMAIKSLDAWEKVLEELGDINMDIYTDEVKEIIKKHLGGGRRILDGMYWA